MKTGFFRCPKCFRVVYLTRDDIEGRKGYYEWNLEKGALLANPCGGCNHWRYYEPLGDFDHAKVAE